MNKLSKTSILLFSLLLIGAGCSSEASPEATSLQDFSDLNNIDIVCCQFTDVMSGTSTEKACAEYGGTIIACE